MSSTLRTPDAPPPPSLSPRYRPLAVIGSGGLGQVMRAWDERLQVDVALKVLHAHLAADPDWRRRIQEEARLLASLRHPGVPPVHDLDQIDDGRPFYTMALIEGSAWDRAVAPLTLRRRVELLREVAETVGWAHERGVVHRDLSPTNVLVERDGRARVIDWGLARRVDATGAAWLSERAATPGFAAPEVAEGLASPRSDVWALGGLLELTLLGVTADGELEELRRTCHRVDPAARPADGGAVGAALVAWLDGQRRRERALRSVGEAGEARERALRARERSAELAAVARVVGEAARRWEQEDLAADAAAEAARHDARAELALHVALHEDGDCDEAHALLVAGWRERLLEADAGGDRLGVARLEAELRGWRGGRYADLADDTGRLAVTSDPPADRVVLQRFVEVRRRLAPVDVDVIEGGFVDRQVPAGSWRLRWERGGASTTLCLRVPRGGVASFSGPDGAPAAVPLAPIGLGPEDVYVPGGWLRPRPDPGAAETLSDAARWVPPYVVRRHPVTVAEWLIFLDDLARVGGRAAAMERAPRELSSADRPRAIARWVDGRPTIVGEGSTWPADWPITLVDWRDAGAYAAWYAARTGLPWRLVREAEWELAARGADGRIYAWGDHIEPGQACMAVTTGGPPGRAPVGAFPEDESPYGVRGMTGNVRDWCEDAWTPPSGRQGPPLYVLRGGAWSSAATMCRLAMRFAGRPTDRLTTVGLRLARSAG